jgi:hypothetical protein
MGAGFLTASGRLVKGVSSGCPPLSPDMPPPTSRVRPVVPSSHLTASPL